MQRVQTAGRFGVPLPRDFRENRNRFILSRLEERVCNRFILLVNAAIVCFCSGYLPFSGGRLQSFDSIARGSFVVIRVVNRTCFRPKKRKTHRSGPVFLFYFYCIEFREILGQVDGAGSDS